MSDNDPREHSHSGVYTDGDRLFTRDATMADGAFRQFPPTVSKLAAVAKLSSEPWPLGPASRVLYLGAGAGTTASFMSDIVRDGQVIAVEFAPEPFRDLVEVARARPNVVPVLADARDPSAYAAQVATAVDVVYQDVAQRDQWDIARRNCQAHLRAGGHLMLVVKASSVDVAAPKDQVVGAMASAVATGGFAHVRTVDLEPFDRGHAVIIAQKG